MQKPPGVAWLDKMLARFYRSAWLLCVVLLLIGPRSMAFVLSPEGQAVRQAHNFILVKE